MSEDLKSGALIRIMAAFEPPVLPIHLVTTSGGHKGPKIRAFLDYSAVSLGKLHVIRPMGQK